MFWLIHCLVDILYDWFWCGSFDWINQPVDVLLSDQPTEAQTQQSTNKTPISSNFLLIIFKLNDQ